MAPANPRHTQGSGEFGGRWLEGSGGVPEDILGGQFGGDGAADGVCTGDPVGHHNADAAEFHGVLFSLHGVADLAECGQFGPQSFKVGHGVRRQLLVGAVADPLSDF